MLKPGKTPEQLIKETVANNRKKRSRRQSEVINYENITKLLDRACSSPCRDEIIMQAITEARYDPSKTTERCIEIGLEEWDK